MRSAQIAHGDRRLERAARRWSSDRRSGAQLREHYTIERELATRLLRSSAEQRTTLYAAIYDELFRRVPHHPQLGRSSAERARYVERELYFLAPLLMQGLSFLEIGAGDLALSRRVAPLVGAVHALDVAGEIAMREPLLGRAKDDCGGVPDVQLHLTDGREIPLEDCSIELAYSNHVMEHLHPADARDQLREVLRVLRPGGRYLCVTPNRLTGPWDVSRLFSCAPTGLHLREYSNRELHELLCEVGFEQIHALVPFGSRARKVGLGWFLAIERVLEELPYKMRRLAVRGPWHKPLNSVRLVAVKPARARLG